MSLHLESNSTWTESRKTKLISWIFFELPNQLYFLVRSYYISWLIHVSYEFTKFNLTFFLQLNNYSHRIRNCNSASEKINYDLHKLWQNTRTFFHAKRIKEIRNKRMRPQFNTFRSLINFWKNKIFNFMVRGKLIPRHDCCEINYI